MSSSAAALVADLVHQRGADAAADQPLARDADDGDRDRVAAGQARPRAADGGARAAVEVTDHGGASID